ncbi:MAG: hypothetical protein M3421_10860, partial [Bacteroidota bacterium]|nr:hypothetical protein [Bacteroidota bacterium]
EVFTVSFEGSYPGTAGVVGSPSRLDFLADGGATTEKPVPTPAASTMPPSELDQFRLKGMDLWISEHALGDQLEHSWA